MTAANASARVLSWATATVTALLLLTTVHASTHASGGSFQNGRLNGAIYAGGLDYTENNIYATGITYGTNGYLHSAEAMCFVSKFHFGKLNKHSETISGIIGDGDSMQACHAIGMMHDTTVAFNNTDQKPFLVGGTSDKHLIFGKKVTNVDDPAGILTALKPWESQDFPLDDRISIDDVGQTNGLSYPISVVFVHNRYADDDGEDDGVAFIASLTSESKSPNMIDPLLKASLHQPNWMKYYKYGSAFEMSLQKYRIKLHHGTTEMNHKYTNTFATDVDVNGKKPEVFIGGMILTRQRKVIVAGSTAGNGAAYGGLSFSDDTDLNGFITVFHQDLELRTEKPTARIGTAQTDLILGICEDANSEFIYIVGTTAHGPGMGEDLKHPLVVTQSTQGSMHGFVQKIDINTLQKVWGVHWGSESTSIGGEEPTVTTGVGCQHLGDGTLYVAGIVESGARAVRGLQEYDGDTIVAMKLDGETGAAEWMTQFGSMNGDENLARSSALAIDKDENLVIYGDTTGSLFRKRSVLDKTDIASDIFLVTLSKKDGSHDPLVHHVDFHEHTEEKKVGMLSGGNWTDAEVKGGDEWYSDDWIATQSGPTVDSVFAGGMVYDKLEDTAFVTGISDKPKEKVSSCMISRLSLESGEFIGWGRALGNAYGEEDILEVCSSITLHGYGEAMAVGYAEKGSLLPGGSDITRDYPMVGFGLMVDHYNLQEVDAIPFITERPNNRFQYPIDVVSDGDNMYILSLTSTDNEPTSEYNELMNESGPFSPNWINIKKFGSSFDMTVTKITITRQTIDGVAMGGVSLTQQWSKEFPVDADGDNTGTIPRVFLGGLILKKTNGYLAVSGSTRGMGDAYGAATGSDEDGFITLLDMNTGELTKSIREGTPEDDFVSGMCHDEDDDTSFYIVGCTKGQMDEDFDTSGFPKGSKYAYLRKVHADTLKPVWTVQLGAVRSEIDGGPNMTPTTAKAIDCVAKGGYVYAAGIVDDNAGMRNGHKVLNSRGGDDIWFGSFSADSGEKNWLRQEGSDRTDHIAPHGAMAIKKNGNILIFGDTNGQFFRKHIEANRNVNELFLLEVEKDGKYKPSIKNPNHNGITHPATHQDIDTIPESNTTPAPFLVDEDLIEELIDAQADAERGGLPVAVEIILGLVGAVAATVLVLVLFYLIRQLTGLGAKKSVKGTSEGLFQVKAPPQSSFLNGNPQLEENIQEGNIQEGKNII